MKAAYNSDQFRTLWRTLSVVAIVMMLAAPPLFCTVYCDGSAPTTSVSVSPGSTVGGGGITLAATINVAPPGPGPFDFRLVGFVITGVPYWTVSYTYGGAALLSCDQSSTTVLFHVFPEGQPTLATFTSGGISAHFVVLPSGQAANPANLGPCKQCPQQAGAPVNLTSGNVWIRQRDYSVPGLGGGLELSRVWNSRWLYAVPPSYAGMFGFGWRSTYEEQLMVVDGQTLQYWLGDGSAWTFIYNSALNSYSIASPPDERAQLVSNPTGGFTLTLADGTQKVFNSQNLLSTIIDRNNNQTTLAYDSSNRLTSVTSPGGATLSFTYGDSNNPMQVTTVQDSVGVVATYTYDSSSRLTSVTYADGSALNVTYDPSSSMILSVTDSQGKVSESHTYDSQDRGLTSSRAYGVDSVTLTY
jgi:YD repeat-containing protein